MLNFENLLTQDINGWHWQLPTHFNIAYACVRQHVEQGNGSQLAMIVEDQYLGTTELTYGELDKVSGQFNYLLKSLHISEGDRVLIRLPNATSYPVSFFGCLKHGAVAVPTSTLLSASEVAYLAKDSGAKVLVTDKSMWPELSDALGKDDNLQTVLLAGEGDIPEAQTSANIEVIDLTKALRTSPVDDSIVASRPDDAAYLVYTSGTTGFPKGVLHGHRSLIGRIPASRYWFNFKSGDRILHSGKFNWTYVLGSALMDPLFHGHTVIVHEGSNDANTWPQLIAKHQCTIFIGVPTIYRQIIQKTHVNGKDVPSLRHCMSAGEHLSDEMLLAWRQRFAMDIYEAIGMSEFSYYISQHTGADIRPGAAGFIQSGHKVELVDESLQPVTPGQEGMIAIGTDDPGLFLQYWQLPEETAQSRRDGYFLTGDYARQDEDGYIWFIGRKDDIINTFGYRVSPHEIERVIKTHPQVADCVALGDTIAKDKTIVSICVIPTSDQELDETSLLDFGSHHLAKYKAPKQVHIYQDFPRTKNGKVLRTQLQADLANKREQSSCSQTEAQA